MRENISEGELREGGAVKHDVSVALSQFPALLKGTEKLISEKYPDFRLNVYGHVGDGNLHVNIRPPEGKTMADIASRKDAITADVEGLAVSMGGSFSAEHGIGQMRVKSMKTHKSEIELAMMHRIRAALDPTGLFNPGKTIPEA